MARNILEKLSQQKSSFYYYHVNSTDYSNVTVYDCGYEKFSSTLKVVNDYYPYYLMHCVLSGKGILEMNGQEYPMEAGEIFIIPPETKVRYYQDVNDPWSYIYVNFNGTAATTFYENAGFSSEFPSYQYKNDKLKETFTELVNCQNNQRHTLYIYSLLFRIMANIAEERHISKDKMIQTKSYLASAVAYIEKNYQNPEISLATISKKLHLNPSYFSRTFHNMTGSTFLKYLTLFRIRKASDLMAHSDLPINEIANSVGYTDSLYFSSVFKRYRLMTPSEYRRRNKAVKGASEPEKENP